MFKDQVTPRQVVRDQWYGDRRDLVKWAAVVHLAGVHRARAIIQVAFLRDSQPPVLTVNGRDTPLPKGVWRHFYRLRNVLRLQRQTGLRIQVWDGPFPSTEEGRGQYVDAVCGDLRAAKMTKVVLLDPDTGIAPRHPKGEHVLGTEIREVWEALSPGDVLVLYQHQRRDKDWRARVRQQLASACRTRASHVSVLGSTWAHDVALYSVSKG